MTEMKLWSQVLQVAVFLLSASLGVSGQPATQPAAPLNWNADDARHVAELTATGERREGKLVVLFTPAGVVDDKEEAALLDRLDRGMAELRALVGRHSWQVIKAEKITYYVSTDRFVAHASGRAAVFIPLFACGTDARRIFTKPGTSCCPRSANP
jgi:hypothetical protein